VVQTLSKSRSLAGARVGFAIGHADLIEGLERVKNSFNSYPLDMLAMQAAVAAVEDEEYFETTRQKIIASREWTVAHVLVRDAGEGRFRAHPFPALRRAGGAAAIGEVHAAQLEERRGHSRAHPG
jgi:histidinol-phosphate/aromatic aminotransferase/cobyric acid decarboxylase-like protein